MIECKKCGESAEREHNAQKYCRKCGFKNHTKRAAHWATLNPERDKKQKRAYHLRTKFGLEIYEFEAMLAVQGYACRICGTHEFGGKEPQVDHCHDTGDVRGILCWECNVSIGKMGDDPDRLRAAADYIERHRQC